MYNGWFFNTGDNQFFYIFSLPTVYKCSHGFWRVEDEIPPETDTEVMNDENDVLGNEHNLDTDDVKPMYEEEALPDKREGLKDESTTQVLNVVKREGIVISLC